MEASFSGRPSELVSKKRKAEGSVINPFPSGGVTPSRGIPQKFQGLSEHCEV